MVSLSYPSGPTRLTVQSTYLFDQYCNLKLLMQGKNEQFLESLLHEQWHSFFQSCQMQVLSQSYLKFENFCSVFLDTMATLKECSPWWMPNGQRKGTDCRLTLLKESFLQSTIWRKFQHAAQTGSQKIAIRTVDTDVVVMAVAYFQNLQLDEFWIHFGTERVVAWLQFMIFQIPLVLINVKHCQSSTVLQDVTQYQVLPVKAKNSLGSLEFMSSGHWSISESKWSHRWHWWSNYISFRTVCHNHVWQD